MSIIYFEILPTEINKIISEKIYNFNTLDILYSKFSNIFADIINNKIFLMNYFRKKVKYPQLIENYNNLNDFEDAYDLYVSIVSSYNVIVDMKKDIEKVINFMSDDDMENFDNNFTIGYNYTDFNYYEILLNLFKMDNKYKEYYDLVSDIYINKNHNIHGHQYDIFYIIAESDNLYVDFEYYGGSTSTNIEEETVYEIIFYFMVNDYWWDGD